MLTVAAAGLHQLLEVVRLDKEFGQPLVEVGLVAAANPIAERVRDQANDGVRRLWAKRL